MTHTVPSSISPFFPAPYLSNGDSSACLLLESSIHNQELEKQKMVNVCPGTRTPGLPRAVCHPTIMKRFPFTVSSLSRVAPPPPQCHASQPPVLFPESFRLESSGPVPTMGSCHCRWPSAPGGQATTFYIWCCFPRPPTTRACFLPPLSPVLHPLSPLTSSPTLILSPLQS